MMLKENHGGFLAVIACTCLMIPTVVGDTVTSLRAFKHLTHFQKGVNRLDQGWEDSDEVSCARSCLRRYQNCITVMFNPSTRLCTPGSTLNVSAPLVSAEEGDLYILDGCLAHEGFTLVENNGTTACLKIFSDFKNYEDADAACQALGAFLASYKTMNKLAIVKDMVQAVYTTSLVWVGCDDLVEEGVFEWKEDGEKFTLDTVPETFEINEGQDPDEDCIGVARIGEKYLLHDFNCDSMKSYICERYVL